ncbi:MAG TPA: amino acid permease [Terriglobales bacterium]|nr:amino acid permease [Terriglobales bacterium]
MFKTRRKSRTIAFTRDSTGLVKAASSWQAAFWNVANMMGSKFPWSVARLGLFPAALILGGPPYLWAMLLVGLASYVLGIIYVQITSAIPRSGADYVIPSRLMGPFWGWLESWMIVCSLVTFWGYSTWVALRNIKQLVDILRIGGLTTLSVPWVLAGVPAFLLGTLLVFVGMLVCFLPAKRYYKFVGLLTVAAVVGLVVIAAGAVMVSPAGVDTNMQKLTGLSSTAVVQKAISHGFDPNAKLDIAGSAELVGLALFGIGGFQYSATISAELKGDVRRSLLVSIIGSLTIFLVFFLPLVWLLLSKFDYNLVVGWSYLFWNKIPGAPFDLPPINALLLTLASPQLAILWAIVGLIVLLGAWVTIPAGMLYCNRMILSWGIDRFVPEKLSEVNPRLGQPIQLVIAEGVLVAIFFSLTLVNLNPVAYLWWSTLLMFPSFLFPAISALLLPRRHPELVSSVPWGGWLTPLAVLWILIIVPIYGFAVLAAIPSLSIETSLWQYAFSSGLVVTGLVIAIGAAIYVIVREVNVKRGIDVKLIFRSIPPE